MEYKPKGVCSRLIHFDIVDNKVRNVSFVGGCSGNLQGISHLIEGMDVDEAISRIEGIRCGFKPTACHCIKRSSKRLIRCPARQTLYFLHVNILLLLLLF